VGEDPQAREGGEKVDLAFRNRVLPPGARERSRALCGARPSALTGTEQERLFAEVEALLAAGRIAVREPGGGEAEVLLREAVRFRRLAEREQAE